VPLGSVVHRDARAGHGQVRCDRPALSVAANLASRGSGLGLLATFVENRQDPPPLILLSTSTKGARVDLRDLEKAAKQQGWKVDRTTKGHVRFTPKDPTV